MNRTDIYKEMYNGFDMTLINAKEEYRARFFKLSKEKQEKLKVMWSQSMTDSYLKENA